MSDLFLEIVKVAERWSRFHSDRCHSPELADVIVAWDNKKKKTTRVFPSLDEEMKARCC